MYSCPLRQRFAAAALARGGAATGLVHPRLRWARPRGRWTSITDNFGDPHPEISPPNMRRITGAVGGIGGIGAIAPIASHTPTVIVRYGFPHDDTAS